MSNSSPRFSSRFAFLVSALGIAVGTGNIWRFPREAAANGGGAFMIGWLIFLFAWSIPLLIAEFAIGKNTRLGTVGAMRDMAGRNFTWLGIWMLWVGTAVGFYYAVVMGWTIRYFWVALSGEMSGHVCYSDDFYGYDDAMYVGLRLLRILGNTNKSLGELIDVFPKTFSEELC